MLSVFQQVDLTKNFYFSWVMRQRPAHHRCSYSYDITNTLQTNLTVSTTNRKWNTRFMWNYHLAAPAFDLAGSQDKSRWVLPLIHGFVDQASEC